MNSDRIHRLDDLIVDLDRQTVERAGRRIEVGGLSFRLLACLIEQGDRVVGFDELMDAVWAPAVVGEETVTQRVKLLRQALGDDGRRPRYLRSVRGQGYQLCCPPQRMVATPPELALSSRRPLMRRMRMRAGIALLALAVAGAGLWYHLDGDPVASLPEAVIAPLETTLQRAFHYAKIGQDINNERAISLFEQVLVENPASIDARIGLSRAYSARMCLYNRGVESIAQAESLARQVLAEDGNNSGAHDVLAYSFDCRGRIDEAIAEYERAVAIDPVARFDSLASVAYLYMERGRLADALKANVEVAAQRGQLRFYDIQVARNLELLGFVAAAEQRYERSFRLYPDSVYASVTWPKSLFLQGRLAEAEAAVGEALMRPTHPDLFILQGELALLKGMPIAASAAFKRAQVLRPHTSWPNTLRHLYPDGPFDRDWLARQRGMIDASIASGERSSDTYIEKALLEQAAGNKDAAFAALDSAIAAGFCDRAYLQISPLFRALSNDPRLADAIDRIGQHVAQERATILAADWLPDDLLALVKASP